MTQKSMGLCPSPIPSDMMNVSTYNQLQWLYINTAATQLKWGIGMVVSVRINESNN